MEPELPRSAWGPIIDLRSGFVPRKVPQLGLLRIQAEEMARERTEAMMADTWLTKAQVAARLGVHPKTVEKMLRTGVLIGIRLETGGNGPRHVRISESELDRYLRARAV